MDFKLYFKKSQLRLINWSVIISGFIAATSLFSLITRFTPDWRIISLVASIGFFGCLLFARLKLSQKVFKIAFVFFALQAGQEIIQSWINFKANLATFLANPQAYGGAGMFYFSHSMLYVVYFLLGYLYYKAYRALGQLRSLELY